MAIHWKRSMGIALGSLLAALALPGCEAHFCTDHSPLERASDYPWKFIPPGAPPGAHGFGLPLNAWVDHRRMTEFLGNIVMADGVDGLVSRYQFQCTPRAAEAGCADCYTCTRTIAKRDTTYVGLRTVCVGDGEVLVQASVGPGRTVRAMTYWRKQEQAR